MLLWRMSRHPIEDTTEARQQQRRELQEPRCQILAELDAASTNVLKPKAPDSDIIAKLSLCNARMSSVQTRRSTIFGSKSLAREVAASKPAPGVDALGRFQPSLANTRHSIGEACSCRSVELLCLCRISDTTPPRAMSCCVCDVYLNSSLHHLLHHPPHHQ